MRTFKIIIGFLILIGSGKEYISASRQVGSLFSPPFIIVALLAIFLASWLIGSGFSKRKFKIKSWLFVRYYFFSFLAYILIAFFSLISQMTPKNIVEINGMKIPLDRCIYGNKRIIPDLTARQEYCYCLAEKMVNSEMLVAKHEEDLKKGNLDFVFKDKSNSELLIELDIASCMAGSELQWTDKVASSMKSTMMNDLILTEFAETNNIEEYCNCVLKEYRKLPLQNILDSNFYNTDQALAIDEKCTELSKKNI